MVRVILHLVAVLDVLVTAHLMLSGSVVYMVSALGIRARCPGFESRVVPPFHWVAALGKLFTHIASPVSQLQEIGVQKGVFFGAKWLCNYGDQVR